MSTEQLKVIETAWAVVPQHREFQLDDLSVHGLYWPPATAAGAWAPPRTPLVLVHGGAAHAHWWAHLGPALARDRAVLALDLTGHGDSSWKTSYPRRAWASEVTEAARLAGLGPAIYIGHSMGGLIGIVAAALFPESWAGLIAIDAPVTPRATPLAVKRSEGSSWRALYPDLETAVKRFRLVPAQPLPAPELLDYVARHSLRPCPEGVRWKFDPSFILPAAPEPMPEHLRSLRCPLHLIRGELSRLVTPDVAAFMQAQAPAATTQVTIAGAHHHVLLDRPLELTGELARVLARWDLVVPA